MAKYFYAEVVTKNSNLDLRSALEQFVDSNIRKYTDTEKPCGTFMIYLEFRNLSKERFANTTQTFVKRLADLQNDCSSNWSCFWTLYPIHSEGNIGAIIIVFSSDDSLCRIIQKIENIQLILPEHRLLDDCAIRISGLGLQYRKSWLLGQIPKNAKLLDCGFLSHK